MIHFLTLFTIITYSYIRYNFLHFFIFSILICYFYNSNFFNIFLHFSFFHIFSFFFLKKNFF